MFKSSPTYRYLSNKWLKPQQERFRREGFEEGWRIGFDEGFAIGLRLGRMEAREWNRRRLESAAKGIPFDEPFPGSDEKSE